jgi:hypothetical protein
MSMHETLGVLAHHGGMLVDRPELSVGLVHAVARPTGLELDLIARRPLDRRSASRRQADIRAGRPAPSVAPRRLLPPFDEGIDLRVGWLDRDGRAHWEHGSRSASSGDHFAGSDGPTLRTVLRLPPLYGRASVVLAWPEIGFPETVVELALPDRATVARDTVSIWDAPVRGRRAPGTWHHRSGAFPPVDVAAEAGRVVAGAQVLSRGDDAVVALTRLSAVGAYLSMEVLSVAIGERARAVETAASVAVVDGRDALWLRPQEESSRGGERAFRSTAEVAVTRPDGDALVMIVAWPAAGLADACVEIPLDGRAA